MKKSTHNRITRVWWRTLWGQEYLMARLGKGDDSRVVRILSRRDDA